MRTWVKALVSITLILVLLPSFGCTGPAGPPGPQGERGAAGPPGPAEPARAPEAKEPQESAGTGAATGIGTTTKTGTGSTNGTATTSTATTPPVTTVDHYDNPDWPVRWVSIDPPVGRQNIEVTVTLEVPPGSLCNMKYVAQWSPGLYGSGIFPSVVADKDGYAELRFLIRYYAYIPPGSFFPGFFELTNTKTDGSKIIVKHPFTTH